MKWKLNILKSPMPLYYLAKIFGLAPITLKDDRFHSATILGMLYPMILAMLYIVEMIYLTIPEGSGNQFDILLETKLKWSINIAFIFARYFFTDLILITFVLMRKKIACVLNRLCNITSELKDLGIEINNGKFIKNIYVNTAVTNGLLCATIGIANFWIYHPKNYFTLFGNLNNFIDLYVILIFVHVMLCVKQRFVLLNEKLYNTFETVQQQTSPTGLGSRIFDTSDRVQDENILRHGEIYTGLERVRKFGMLHSDLCYIMNVTSQIFSAPIFAVIGERLLALIMCCYWMYYDLIGSVKYSDDSSQSWFVGKLTVFSLLWMAMIIMMLSMLAYASGTTCEQGNATKVVLTNVWIKFKPVELQKEVRGDDSGSTKNNRNKVQCTINQTTILIPYILEVAGSRSRISMFNLQLLQNPVSMSAFGFFDVDYSLVYKIFCTVLTYMIIIIQFDKSAATTVE